MIKNSRNQFVSPGQAYVEKKKKKEKEEKRCRTQAEEQLLELAHSLSPLKKGTDPQSKAGERRPRI